MKKRCIMIFPEFENINIINEIRKKYDPLFDKVAPHITLVFPFNSDLLTEDLESILKKHLCNVSKFNINLDNIIKVSDSTGFYLFLKINKGNDQIKSIHNLLYKSKLKKYKPHWLETVDFLPHMTIGRFTNKNDLENAYFDIANLKESFCSTVDKVSVEIIDEHENSVIEMHINLN